jgi:ribulose-bisphosphate carboxylase large chain
MSAVLPKLAAAIGLGSDRPAEVLVLEPGGGTRGEPQQAEVTFVLPNELTAGGILPVADALLERAFAVPGLLGLRLLDFTPSSGLAAASPGPRFGIEGTRQLLEVWDRPLLGSIVKPSVGLSVDETARRAAQLVEAGLDFVKDDELLADQPHAPVAARAVAVSQALARVREATGRRGMFAFNISADDVERMLLAHDRVLAAGGACVMISLNQVGLAAGLALRRHSRLPIHGHRNGWGFLARSRRWGIEYPAYQALWRLVGIDHMHVNGWGNKFWEPNESVAASMRACLAPMGEVPSPMPVVSSGQWGGQAALQYADVPTVDFMYLAGGGVQGHPDGIVAGVRAITAAWEAATAGVPLERMALDVPELAASLERFGVPDHAV